MKWLLVSGDWFGEWAAWCAVGLRAGLGGVFKEWVPVSGEWCVEGTVWGEACRWVGCYAVDRWGVEGGAQIGKVVRRQSVARIRLRLAVVVDGGGACAMGYAQGGVL